VDNLGELKSKLIEKMSMHGAKRTAMEDTWLELIAREVVDPG
jgi:hypothetical protein